jgi:3-oxoacyl-[acyl-carrier-protein] synthase II
MNAAVTGTGIVHAVAASGVVDELDEQVRAVGCPRIGRMDRISRLMLLAAHRAFLTRGGVSGIPSEARGISFGTGFGCLLANETYHRGFALGGMAKASPTTFAQTVSNAAAGEVSIQFGIEGPNATLLSAACAGLDAIGEGAAIVWRGDARLVLAGGGDALAPPLLDALDRMGVLAPGVRPTECAAVFVLEPEGIVDPARVIGRVVGHASAFVPEALDADAIAATVMDLRARVGGEDAGRVYATRGGVSASLADAVVDRAFPRARAEVLDPRIGETFGASGAIAAGIALDELGPGGPSLVVSLSYTGHVSVLALAR